MNKRIKKKKSLPKGKFFNDRYLVSLLISGLEVKARCRDYKNKVKSKRKQRAEAEGGSKG